MNVDYVNIIHISNTDKFGICAGKISGTGNKTKLVDFIFKIDKEDVQNLNIFSNKIENGESSKLKIGDDSYINYQHTSDTLTFCANNFMIKLKNSNSPESLREELSDMCIDLE